MRLDDLTAAELRALFARTPDAATRRAIQRRLQQLADLPERPAVTTRKAPQMQESDFRGRFLALRPPTTRRWWSLEQITDALDRTTAEANDKKEGK